MIHLHPRVHPERFNVNDTPKPKVVYMVKVVKKIIRYKTINADYSRYICYTLIQEDRTV